MTPDQQPALPSRSHGVIVGLLFFVLLLSLLTVGFIVTTQKTLPTDKDMANACKSQVESAVLDGVREITRACATEDAPTAGHVPAQTGGLGFDYPSDWSAMAGTNVTGGPSWYAALVPGYFFMCDGCDGPIRDISMTVGSKTDPNLSGYADFHSYIVALYADANSYSNIVITPSKDVGGERYTVSGDMNGLYSGPFETIYFEGPTKYANVSFFDTDPASTETNDAWALVKDSLDFSGIQQ